MATFNASKSSLEHSTIPRRTFLHALGGLGVSGTLGEFLKRSAYGKSDYTIAGYGPLQPVADQTTGLKLLQLPEGFRYLSFGWNGDVMADGGLTPGVHDGMGIIGEQDGVITMCRNHELKAKSGPFGTDAIRYDPEAGGGCSLLTFDANDGRWLEAKPALAGTVKNCAGGTTPWGTWLTCEESVLGPGGVDGDERFDFQRDHGWIFEVTADGAASPVPLKAMGRFVHEAVAVDPVNGFVYETEDRGTAGFYRFKPNEPGKLAAGGQLEMLKVPGVGDLRRGVKVGQQFDVDWVAIEDVERAHSPKSSGGDNPAGDELGVFMQGKMKGGATFARLEGCWWGNDLVYIVSTSGGEKDLGQVWQYDPRNNRLKLIFESPDSSVVDSPDNICVSPRGGLVLCEDGDVIPQHLRGMTQDGRIFPFAANNVVLHGEHNNIRGDFRGGEWAGANFSKDGQWLFANIQDPGITFAITGPWGNELL
ncbi:hypothetical protein Pan258_30670 [Symmachiella dynata]|uniref:alkaline phosphatase PhoX n=1 Tax=Symmachiella dynata TaxID=2527995 RepID=UPI0011884CA1|nr:alkaline phosphatase PhoX [Symmachiella dynata]QDT49020.1 hypothetical protein Pan258_30670 [Symmachiella dynata]